jgi:outer membrane protein
MLRPSIVVLFFALSTSTAAAQSAAERLTLDDAVALALAHNRALATASMAADKARTDLETARSYRLPQFNVEAQASELLRPIDLRYPAGAFGTFEGLGPIPAVDTKVRTPQKPAFVFSLTAAQPLTQLHRLNLGVRMSEKSSAIEVEGVRAARLALVNEVKRLYFQILQSESALEASTHAVAQLREVSRVVADRVVQQVALKSDTLDVEARLGQAEHTQLTARHAIASQKERLNVLMGRDVRHEFSTSGLPAPTPREIDLAAAQARALEARPDVRQARLKAEQAGLARRIAKAERLPDVSLTVSYLSPMNIEGAPRNIATAGVQLEWEPFDWGRRARTIAARALEQQQASHAVRDAEDKALVEVNAQVRTLEEARSQLRVAGLTRETAREASRVRADQYRVRAVLLADVLQADATRAEADHRYHQALLALLVARADLERAIGDE